MDTSTRRETAKIYQFPPGGRRPARDERQADARQLNEAPRPPVTTAGGGWYHDQAITAARDAHAHPGR